CDASSPAADDSRAPDGHRARGRHSRDLCAIGHGIGDVARGVRLDLPRFRERVLGCAGAGDRRRAAGYLRARPRAQSHQRVLAGAVWGGWVDHGGILTSEPRPVAEQGGQALVFVRGLDLGLWVIDVTAATPGTWVSLDGILTSAPAPVSPNPARF